MFLHENQSSAALLSQFGASAGRRRAILGQTRARCVDAGTEDAIPLRFTVGEAGDGGSDQQRFEYGRGNAASRWFGAAGCRVFVTRDFRFV
jgi:hypothetical protein